MAKIKSALKQNVGLVLIFIVSVIFFEGCKPLKVTSGKRINDTKDAKVILKRFFACAELEYISGVPRPQLPSVDQETSEALANCSRNRGERVFS